MVEYILLVWDVNMFDWPQLSVAAPFWLVNKSGLPLVFRQDCTRIEAAGQFEEHEQARSVTPLLFSFSDHEEPNL